MARRDPATSLFVVQYFTRRPKLKNDVGMGSAQDPFGTDGIMFHGSCQDFASTRAFGFFHPVIGDEAFYRGIALSRYFRALLAPRMPLDLTYKTSGNEAKQRRKYQVVKASLDLKRSGLVIADKRK